MTLDPILLFAAGHRGLVTRTEAFRKGMTPRMVKGRLASGEWVRCGRGVYRVSGAPVTWEQRALVACLVAGPGAVASHTTAGVLWKMAGLRPGRPEITVSHERSGRAAEEVARVHHSRHLDRADRTTVEGIPVTTAVRTLIDLAGHLPAPVLTEAVDDVLCRRPKDRDLLVRRSQALPRRQPGAANLARALEAWTPGPAPDVPPEMELVRVLVAHGLPAPERQVDVWDGGRLVARLDLAWQGPKVALESDSWRWHGSSQRYHHTVARTLELRDLGWDVIPSTSALLVDGGARLCAVVAATLARRQPAGQGSGGGQG